MVNSQIIFLTGSGIDSCSERAFGGVRDLCEVNIDVAYLDSSSDQLGALRKFLSRSSPGVLVLNVFRNHSMQQTIEHVALALGSEAVTVCCESDREAFDAVKGWLDEQTRSVLLEG